MLKISGIHNFLNYFFLFMIIALTGFEFFFRDNNLIYYMLFPLSAIVFIWKKVRVNYWAIGFILLILIILSIHSLKFGVSFSFIFTAFIRFLTYYFIASIISTDFSRVFINIAYFLSVISLVFFLLSVISSPFYHFLVNISANIKPLSLNVFSIENWTNPNHTLILYTVPLEFRFRNNGPFWEPGMFGVIINIALVLNVITKKQLLEKRNIVLLITSISTLSAASLISSIIIIAYYYLFINRNIYSFVFIIVAAFTLQPIYNSPYIKGKIEANLSIIDRQFSRFGAAIYHWEQIKKEPLSGMGLQAQKEEQKMFKGSVSPNGLTNVIRFYGVPLSLLFYILFYRFSVIEIILIDGRSKHSFLLFIILLLVAFSQDVTTRHLYYLFLFLPFVFYKNIKYLNQ